MDAAATPSLFLLLIDVAFAILMLAIGVAAGWWLFRDRAESSARRDAERARAALERIRGLASSVAQDVGAHSTRVQEITTELSGAQADGSRELDGAVLATVAQMLEANKLLQSQLATAEERLQQQAEEIEIHAADARTDALTQLANRRAFDDELERRYAEWRRMQTSYAVFLVDVDHFKKFNDVHGHQAGDEVLRGVARVLKGAMRELDLVCRYGGEEFAVIMPATEGEVAKKAAYRARRAIEQASFRFEGAELKVTASLGLAEILPGEDATLQVKRADEALYASKEAGRNCAHFHDGERSTLISLEDTASGADPSGQRAAEESIAKVSLKTLDQLPDASIFSGELRRRLAEGQRFKVPLSVLLIHVDNLASFSSRYGEPVGNLVLDTVAQYLEILLRDMDLLARYTSSRFAAMLPGSPLPDTLRVAERVRGAISACVIPMPNSKLQLTVSLGIAEALPNDDSESLLERAEQALTASLAAGHNSIYVHDGESCQVVAPCEITSA